MTGVILAAGDGIRFNNSIGEECCKALVKVNNMLLIEFALNNLKALCVAQVYIVVGKHGNLIKDAIGNEYNGMKVFYVSQPVQKGLINAFIQALKYTDTGDSVVLQLADEVFAGFDSDAVNAALNKGECDFYCGITYESDPDKIKANYSVKTDKNMLIEKCTEKPTVIINNIKGTGFCIFGNKAIKELKAVYDEDKNVPNDLCDYINYLISKGRKGGCICIADKEFNINTCSDLAEAIEYVC